MEEDSSIERLDKKLYTRKGESILHPRRDLHGEGALKNVSGTWKRDSESEQSQMEAEDPAYLLEELRAGHLPGTAVVPVPEILTDERVSAVVAEKIQKRRMVSRFVRAFFLAAALFFIFSAGIAGYFLFLGKNQVSCNNMDIAISGPLSIPSGKELLLNVSVTNNNKIPIEKTDLLVDFPEGARSADNTALPMAITREHINTIEPGERVRTTAHAVLFGKEQSKQLLKVSVEYKIADSDADLYCEKPYEIVIATSPVTMAVEGIEEVASGQDAKLTVTITSNSDEVVPDMRLVAEYPFGFEFSGAQPNPTTGTNVWELGDIAPHVTRTVAVRGIMRAQAEEGRVVRFSLGEKDKGKTGSLLTTLQTIEHPLFVTRPFIAVDLSINGVNTPEIAANFGDTLNGVLTWRNELSYPVYGAEISLALPGSLVDRSTVRAGKGFFRSVDQTIVWTPQTNEKLEVVDPGEEGSFDFEFVTKKPLESAGVSDPSMVLMVSVRAKRVSEETPVSEDLVAQAKRTLQFNSILAVTPRVTYSTGPFVNTGSHPPRVDKETTYTISWNVQNTTSEMRDVELSGQLPINVVWRNKVVPEGEEVVYDPTSREVRWSVGNLQRGVGRTSPAREVSFQIAFTPSITEVGEKATLILSPHLRGVDQFTGAVVERNLEPQTTELTDDPYFVGDEGKVAE